MRTKVLILLAGVLTGCASAQTIFFDFDNAPLYTPLPIDLTTAGVTAHFSATGQGYSIQGVSTAPVVPAGFSGRFIYPSSIFASDLSVSFSQTLAQFSIQYAPQELACDSSATMRVTAYSNEVMVATTTTNAAAGTWPVETLLINSPQGFNKVVVHYDKAPVTGGDYGVIFIADNMAITPLPPPLVLGSAVRLSTGEFQFDFQAATGASFTVLRSTNVAQSLPLWTSLGAPSEIAPGQFRFVDAAAVTNTGPLFYQIRSR